MAATGSNNKPVISLLFSSYVTLALFSPPCLFLRLSFYLNHFGRSDRKYLFFPSVLSGYNRSPDTCFSQRTTWLISWPDGERYLRPLQSLVVSLLLSLVSSLVFSRTGGLLSHQNSSTYKLPRFPTRSLWCLVTLAVFPLLYAAADTVYC